MHSYAVQGKRDRKKERKREESLEFKFRDEKQVWKKHRIC